MKKILTVDLDSTLCDTGHRHHMIDRVNGTDWSAYSKACSNDEVIEATLSFLKIAQHGVDEIHFVTGRTEDARAETNQWLMKEVVAHGIMVDGLWMDETPDGDHFAAYGSHSAYKVARVQDVARWRGGTVVLHIDDWAEVKVALEAAGIPCLCVRTPQEVEALTSHSESSELR